MRREFRRDRLHRDSRPTEWRQERLFDVLPPLPEPLGEVDVADVFEAYRRCRRSKRRSASALAFEVDHEANLVALWRDMNTGMYRPEPASAFIVQHPVRREVFAATFRDRVVHHWLIGKIGDICERDFIHDTYACRDGRGTLFGIRRLERFIRQCSENYTRPCYVLRLDISSFFMSIDTSLLLERVERLILDGYQAPDVGRVIQILRTVITSDPTSECRIRGRASDWHELPHGKSLFDSRRGCGLPIGNLTSQVLANVYLSPLDHYIKGALGFRFYGRYVDDLVLVHHSRKELRTAQRRIEAYVREHLHLKIHPRKVWLQEQSHGVRFLGVVIKPGRTYPGSRTKRGFTEALHRHRLEQWESPSRERLDQMVASVNSYLGLLQHFSTTRLRRRMLSSELGRWWEFVYTGAGFRVIRLRPGTPAQGTAFAGGARRAA